MKPGFICALVLTTSSLAQEKPQDPFGSESKGSPAEAHSLVPDAETLKSLGEPSLETWKDADQYPAIRLLLVRTFHAPISIRAYLTKDGPRLRVAVMSGKGGYEWGKLSFEKDFPLKKEVWDQMLLKLQEDGVRQPLKTDEKREYFYGLDGSTWTLEVADKSGYTVDQAWSPTFYTERRPEYRKAMEQVGVSLDNFVSFCKLLLQYAPTDTGPIY